MRVKIISAAIPVTVMFAVAALGGTARAQTPPPTVPAAAMAHNVVIFVADGLRFRSVDDGTAPNMAMLARQGASLVNGHSLFPTLTMANASAIATGHLLGDTGVFANTLYAGFPVPAAAGSPTPFIENDAVLGDLDSHFGGDLLNQDTIFKLARDKGYSTAAIGKVGPTLLFDHTERSGLETIIIDDFTGTGRGIPVAAPVMERLKAAGLAAATPSRGANGAAGDATTPGTTVANVVQQDYFAAVATRVVLPLLASRGKPFLFVFWSRDPDGTQHNQGDSFLAATPGINGAASLAAIRNADDDLGRVRATLAELGIAQNTDIMVTADHGFATIAKESAGSPAAKERYADVPPGLLPPGFLALDLARALGMPLIDHDNGFAPVGNGRHPRFGNGIIGGERDHPKIVVAADGGADLIYVPDGDKAQVGRIVEALLGQDYVAGIFVDSRLGRFPGTLSLADIALEGTAATPRPAIVVGFRTSDTICGEPVRCPLEIADTTLQKGQGMHGAFGRAETWNFMALAGPDFKSGFIDKAPVNNADIARTAAAVLGLNFNDKGKLTGRILSEAMTGAMPEMKSKTLISEPAANGLRTVVDMQTVGDSRYFDAGGFIGRTLGLSPGTGLTPP